jgi:hypothetical protein
VSVPALISIIILTFYSLTNQVSDVLVRTRFTETLCPLLSKMQRDPIAVEQEIRDLLGECSVGVCVVLCSVCSGMVYVVVSCCDVMLFVALYCVLSYDIAVIYSSTSRVFFVA